MDEITLNGVGRIAEERVRQIEVEGWNQEHDAQHQGYELLVAASRYIDAGIYTQTGLEASHIPVPPNWPWGPKWWKPSDDPIRNLEKAGALIAAEIDRLLALK